MAIFALSAATVAADEASWRRVALANPAGFESRIIRSLDGALNRLSELSTRRFPWQRGDRDLLETTALNVHGGWRRHGDALRLLLQVWRHREDPIFLPGAIEALADLALDERAIDELEVYLPQIACMALAPESLLSLVLERFALRLCETNAHWALQLSWAVYAILEDNRPERGLGANPEAYSRAARLLQLIEQSVVYGAKMVNRDSLRADALAHNVQLWRRSLLAKLQDSLPHGGADVSAASDERLPASVSTALEKRPSAVELEAGAGVDSDGALLPTAPALEGYLLKRKHRDRFGVWRCCGESWTRRWFVLRGSVLFYYRSRTDTRPRGAMPLGQCQIELRPSSRGDYIRLSTRFSHHKIRIRAEAHADVGPQLTHMWMRALRAAAGLTPIKQGPPAVRPHLTAPTATATDAASDTAALDSDSAPPPPPVMTAVLPPVDILEGADMAMDTSTLSMSQRCAWLYLRAQRGFVRSLAMVSEALFTPGAPGSSGIRPEADEATARLRALLEELRPPPLAYLPLCASSGPLMPVCRVLPDEGSVFLTRARASALVCLEVMADPHGRKLSQLFSAVRSRGALADELSEMAGTPTDTLALRHMRSRTPLMPPAPPSAAAAAATAPTPAPAPTPRKGDDAAVLDRIFGASWSAKAKRVRASSPHGRAPGWSLVALITKANDDVRQEVFVMQCLALFAAVYPRPLRLRPYRILATGPSSGLIEMVTDTLSLDRFKRRSGFPSLRAYFEAAYGGAGSATFAAAQQKFACSLAAYSIACYVLCIKDRHNGNILLDREGYLVHIDFGFVLGQSTKIGQVSGENAVPFKLTREFVDVLGGPEAPLFTETFVELCTAALRAIREHSDTLLALTEVTMLAPALPCFAGQGRAPIEQLRQRLLLHVPDDELRERVRQLVLSAYDHSGYYLYDRFQKASNGIEF